MEFDNILNKKYLNYQDYECIKTLIHKCSDVEVRNNMLLDVFQKIHISVQKYLHQ